MFRGLALFYYNHGCYDEGLSAFQEASTIISQALTHHSPEMAEKAGQLLPYVQYWTARFLNHLGRAIEA